MTGTGDELVIRADDPAGWAPTGEDGTERKVLHSSGAGGLSIVLTRLAAGAELRRPGPAAGNVFTYCLDGSYADHGGGDVLAAGSFLWNAPGSRPAPTEALEDCLLLQVMDDCGEDPGTPRVTEDGLAGVGTRLLHSNELINVWEVRLEPGQTHPWHHHEYPYVVVTIRGGQTKITRRQDGVDLFGDSVPGSVAYDPGGIVHRISNVGDAPIVDRLVEFRTAPASLRPARVRLRPDEPDGSGT